MIEELAEEGFKKVGYIGDTKLPNGLNKISYVEGFKDGFNKALENLRCCENCKHHGFMGNELICHLDFDVEFECLGTMSKWELWEREQ